MQSLPAQEAAALQDRSGPAQDTAEVAADQHSAQAFAGAAGSSEEVQQVHTPCLTADDAPRRCVIAWDKLAFTRTTALPCIC
jgi:hypothetical protein